ncbi:MAG TPA: Na+/H+ antiporter subunit E [Geminicoccaceae bacterium]|nr:Na+/H+ antiporter subunit E [Geminicoccus sp.]HMU48991.1 Na+/H+ antiporter subunit E [Geminicoccaceae bacterium]
MVVRTAGFWALWLAFAGAEPVGLVVGLGTAVAAALVSRRLLPAGKGRPGALAALRLALRFLGQSWAGGLDVGRRVFHPALPLRTGFVRYPLRLPAGAARGAFCTLASLVPGTLPAGIRPDGLRVHCLDLDMPVLPTLARDEALLAKALGAGTTHG